jgi:hypothetical protein
LKISYPQVRSFGPSNLDLKYDTAVDVFCGTCDGKVARLEKRTSEEVGVAFNDDFANVRYLKPSNVKIRSNIL